MGKKSNKSLRDVSYKKGYSDSADIVKLREELIAKDNSKGYGKGFKKHGR